MTSLKDLLFWSIKTPQFFALLQNMLKPWSYNARYRKAQVFFNYVYLEKC